MSNKKRIIFIINPISGTQKKDDFPELIDHMLDHSKFDIELRFTEYRGHAAEIARQSAADGIDVVVAVGGDGTVNEVARSLVHTNTALGIIPCGSGNGYRPGHHSLWFRQRACASSLHPHRCAWFPSAYQQLRHRILRLWCHQRSTLLLHLRHGLRCLHLA